MKNKKGYWERKSLFGKISDLIFVIFIIALLFPQGRMAIGGFVNNIKAKLSTPAKLSHEISLAPEDYNWVLTNEKGEQVNLQDYKGKVLFVNLWATWCPPCVGEMPEIQKLYDIFKNDDNVRFFMISNENTTKTSHFKQQNGYTFPIYTARTNPPAAFATRSIPTTFVISKSGKIVIKKTGAANWGGKKMQEMIRDFGR